RRSLSRWRAARLAPAALAVLLAQGCVSMAPQYARPAAPVAATYPDQAATAGGAALSAARIDWRGYFTDPVLQGLIGDALAHNRD
ncbi:RND transporter, partial [Burkholderia sp. SIMBA_013]